ncbi:MAG: hypothetical protein BGP24_17775 [Lysobacterales bacterium 69-70]|nr:UPF0149 family protein [Xanthomonadaceae bacterium]ODU32573.1 MAG: hypothetical protein ABS97_15660 [Xanthomonadaceae bacterium SCN 69-320]ODV19359.1 MAG: hypothetical protein ABT27_11450 [Xanthomonadaceae bacterium SCN 69-25]OJZ00418.1 MAG: hypothetical protein BGP24_17775 [Xanthomonadales bacterium 69-70]
MNQRNDLTQPLDDAEIEILSRFLDEHAVERDGMSFEMLDGYLTAVLSGPDTIMPSEWLPLVWSGDDEQAAGDEAGVFEDEAEAGRILDLVMRHYNRVAGVLAQGGAEFEPWIGEFELEDGEVAAYGQEWALGYLRGVSLREEAWSELLDDADWADDLEALDLLARGPDDEETGGEVATQDQRDALIDSMVGFALDAHDYWLEQRLKPATVRREQPKVGRNDACPCGSGKKYKQCCGQGN